MLRYSLLACTLLSLTCLHATSQEKTAMDYIKEAAAAAKADDFEKAAALCGEAIQREPKRVSHLLQRGVYLERAGKNQDAARDFSRAIELDPENGDSYHLRGCVQFKLGKIAESIADFDKYLKIDPQRKSSHWQRGISCYYAGKFDEGKAQFESYQKFDGNDVENAVWRFLCQAKKDGIDKARKDMLKIDDDQRVPMKEVYDLFMGKLKPQDVLDAAKNQKTVRNQTAPLFYAHLYLGLYFDAIGDRKKALEHLNIATDDYRTYQYMWDVARIHRDLLK